MGQHPFPAYSTPQHMYPHQQPTPIMAPQHTQPVAYRPVPQQSAAPAAVEQSHRYLAEPEPEPEQAPEPETPAPPPGPRPIMPGQPAPVEEYVDSAHAVRHTDEYLLFR
jgi:hypothetical protein